MLSYSQLDRILRPLRNKCNAFAKSIPNVLPPLSVLPPPRDTTGGRVHFDKHRVDNLEFSRKTYAVRYCFKDVLAKILGRSAVGAQERIIGLADLCAMVVGSTLQMELNQSEDDEEDRVVQLLESVPQQYRRKADVAHSLEVVLQLCPHHPTLLQLLLDLTLAYNLANESYILLRALLTVACTADTTSNPPICHPAHQTFFLDVCKLWTSSGLTTRGFIRVLLEVVRTADPTLIWTCKALATFMPELAKDDMTSFMTCIYELLGSLSKIGWSSTTSEQRQPLRAMLDIACRYLLSQDLDQDMDWIPIFLDHLGCLTESSSEDIILDATSALICLATHWLSRRPPPYQLAQLAKVEHLLDNNKPRPTTYNVMLSLVATSGDLQKLKESVQLYAGTLRSHGLLHHEASLWACTLRQVESPAIEQLLSVRSSAKTVKAFRLELIDRVEDAEKRCFGRRHLPLSPKDDNASSPRRRNRSSDGAWSWDPILECWHRVQDSEPALKKLRKDPRVSCSARRDVHKKFSQECDTQMDSENDSSLIGLQSKSRGTNFATLLCRAISNRTALHPEKQFEDRAVCSSPEQIARNMDSDDALNLFL